ncbi:hypothetical protein PTKIN_Ptkin09bG0002000 [Pterospermum kingtungense]
MAQGTIHLIPNQQQLELQQILHESRHRWLRPVEVCRILSNYTKFPLSDKPPTKPLPGSVYLFDRKTIRYFRKDGHDWRKKKDGKTVQEAHEKLKIGRVDVLHCYYAHGQFNVNFQRRSYWMLDGKFEHIVFVHYREVNEGYRSGISCLVADPIIESESVQTVSGPSLAHENEPNDDGLNNDEPGELKKFDTFGRLIDKAIGGGCDDSLMASDFAKYWNTLDTETDDKEVSSLSHYMQLDIDSLGPSLSQEQLFSIVDFSPDWAYSGVETKVLLIGNFLRTKEFFSAAKWSCMFGEIEVSAEVLTSNVIRCQVPSHAPGRVPFYVTCSNRLACSEVREFEYREKPPFTMAVKSTAKEEMDLLVRLAKLLNIGPRRKWLGCSVGECVKCRTKNSIYLMGVARGNDCIQSKEGLIQNLLKDRLCRWLLYRVHEDGKGPHILDDEGQGVIHLTASLGYEWAMDPIVAAGVSPNFRDARGRTALHWASYFGREETVIMLIKLGASPGAVDDPTPNLPGGRTAADLASSRGHKGIAGYLAEAHLINNLSSLTVNQNMVSNDTSTPAAQKAIETTAQVAPSNEALDEHCSLKGSLAAVRKSVLAAALIQASFQAHSFCDRQLTKGNDEMLEVLLEPGILGSFNRFQKTSHFGDYLHTAASKIQEKYRGWKGRKEFLKIRNRIVKIQAHVRGHQVRKQYKKIVWAVSIVVKVILQWRRKGAGLRGFRVQKSIENATPEIEKDDEYEFLRVGREQKVHGIKEALSRVKSMARNQEARDQYMRLATKFGESKVEGCDKGSSDCGNVETHERKVENLLTLVGDR